MIACPVCKRRIFTHRDFLRANLGGWLKCPACAHLARLDQLSRSLLACLLALSLFLMLLYGNLFYSGYLFVFSTIFILGGWRLLSAAALPLIALESVPGGIYLNRRQSIGMLTLMIVVAIAVDGLLAYRSDADKADDAAAPQAVSVRSD